jgi:uncharacterized protein (DUF1800 family)
MTAPIIESNRRSHSNRAGRPHRGAIAVLVALVVFCTGAPAATQDRARDIRTAAHFLEQATFGPSPADVALVESVGRDAWLQQQFAMPETAIPDALDGNQVRNQLFLNMANGSDQLRQRMMFALSQIIVVSSNKTGSGEELTPWIRLLSRNAFGNYHTLLRDVTLSPTMGKYLDMAYSRRATSTSSPNENYARELLQLFSIGLWELNQDGTLRRDSLNQPIPSYTQATIAEFARALTGWTFPTMPDATPSNSNPQYFVGEMLARVTTHDTGAKTLLNGVTLPANQTTTQDMDAVVNNIFNHPNVAPFVSTRLIRSLVTSNPSSGYIHRVANVFSNNGAGVRGDLRAVLTAILTDPEATSFAAEDGRLKDPILHVLGLGRALGATISNPDSYNYVFNNLTQRVLSPTTVFSFYSPLAALPGHTDLFGPEFQIYPPALAIQRANFIYSLVNGSFASSFTIDLTPFTALAGDVPALVERVNQSLMFGRMTPELRELIVAATNAVPVASPRDRAVGALYLAAISSEYSVYSDNSTAGSATVQPPTGLVAASVAGNVVTVTWRAPLIGPVPTQYVLEAGVAPGQVIASIPTGSVAPSFSFAAPPGAYYIRMHSMSGPVKSRASSEIRIFVDVPAGPTAPANLLGVISGSSTVGLSWRNTFGGGAPTSMVLDVSGAINTSLPLGVVEAFSFAGVPAGQYTFSVRAVNATGTSGSSNPVTLTFPRTSCSGSPTTPTNLSVIATGNTISLSWLAATSGNAALSYQVDVTGAYTGRLSTTARTMSGAVGRGTYNIRVRAVNPCGNSGYTAVQTVVIP